MLCWKKVTALVAAVTVMTATVAGNTMTVWGDEDTSGRDSFITETGDDKDALAVKPSVPEIKLDDDLGNLINLEDFAYISEDLKDMLKKNGFAVTDTAGREFYEVYENNRYFQTPNFVTVDSMMHTYHLYFAYLLRTIEKDYLYDSLKVLTDKLQKESYEQYKALKGTDWEDAAFRNVTFFSLAAVLLDDTALMPKEVSRSVSDSYKKIMSAEGIDSSDLTGDDLDYSQFKPRGYYAGDETLESYFRAMMLYGQIQFNQAEEDMDRSAMLMTLAINDTDYDLWDSIYTVTAFFAGASDDLGYSDYLPVIEDVYGKKVSVSDVASDDAAWKEFHSLTAKLRAPRINSIPIADTKDADNVIPGYRFMGQRFTIDATIMQELIYRRVGEFEDEDKRLLPDFLDVPAALGSDMAYSILDEMGQTKYKNYDKNLDNLKKEFANDDNPLWHASLYAQWLNTLRPLLDEKGKGYPGFMQNDEWTKKDLETFAGSYTELKHDTVLYSKQVMAEMGGDWDEDKDYRGYVQPEPLVFSRFESLAKNTQDGLEKFGFISKEDAENLTKLAQLAGDLKEISIKELENKKLTDDEYDLIEAYGGELEHFWLDVMKAQTGEEYPSADNYPAAIVVDVATDPNGQILEMATGDPSEIFVIVSVDGKPRIATGAVYSFYQFTVPISERMTDDEWRQKMGISFESYEEMPEADPIDQPEWTQSYRCVRYE